MIVFVMGPACAGKSTFIKHNFPDFKKIDLYDYEQKNGFSFEGVYQAYEECRIDLIDAVNKKENVVLEHTLLKAIRRKVYIDSIREITDEDIVAYFIYPSDKQLESNAKKRNISFFKGELENIREIAEMPTIDEGFSEVNIITKNIYKGDK